MKKIIIFIVIILMNFSLLANDGLKIIEDGESGISGKCGISGTGVTFFKNFATLSSLNTPFISINYWKHIEDISFYLLSGAYRISKTFSAGGFIVYQDLGEINNTGSDSISVNNTLFSAGVSKTIKKYSFGIGMKYFKSNLGPYSASAFFFQLGITFPVYHNIKGGFIIDNVGSNLKYLETEEKEPIAIGIGIRGDVPEKFLGFSAEIENDFIISDDDQSYRCGIKIFPYKYTIINVGLIYENSVLSFTAGGGVNYSNFQFNLGILPVNWSNGDFSLTYIAGIKYYFKKKREVSSVKKIIRLKKREKEIKLPKEVRKTKKK